MDLPGDRWSPGYLEIILLDAGSTREEAQEQEASEARNAPYRQTLEPEADLPDLADCVWGGQSRT